MTLYRKAQPRDIPPLKALWLRCFQEKEAAAELFFAESPLFAHGYLAERGGEPVAAVYLLDCRLCGAPAHYLCGAATLPEYRGQGVMTALIGTALRDAAGRGDRYSVLLPAGGGLYAFYARMGYLPLGAVCRKDFACGEDVAAHGVPENMEWEKLQAACHRDSFLLWNENEIAFAGRYYACYGVQTIQNGSVCALYEQSGDRAEVFYAAYTSLAELKRQLAAAGVRRFTLTGSAANPDFADCRALTYGMLKPLRQGVALPEHVFIGLTLS